MAILAGSFKTYEALGNREDLTDVIYNISPTETPITTNIARVTAEATRHEWQTDALAAASKDNAQLEADDIPTATTVTPTVRLGNICQIMRKDVTVSGTQETVKKAGRKSELAYQIAKLGDELKRDLEAAISQNNASVAGAAGTPRRLGGLESWYATNDDRGASGADGGYNTGTSLTVAPTDGTQRALTEQMLKNVLQSIFNNSSASADMVVAGGFNKQQISTFTGNATKMKDISDGTLQASVDVYQSDFGEVSIFPSRFVRARTVHVLQSDMLAIAYLRPFFMKDLASTGDYERKMMILEATLEVRNERAHGVIADLTTS
jgi:hypothetical protein